MLLEQKPDANVVVIFIGIQNRFPVDVTCRYGVLYFSDTSFWSQKQLMRKGSWSEINANIRLCVTGFTEQYSKYLAHKSCRQLQVDNDILHLSYRH